MKKILYRLFNVCFSVTYRGVLLGYYQFVTGILNSARLG